MSVELPEEILAALRPFERGSWGLRSEDQVALIIKVSTEEAEELRRASVEHRVLFARFPLSAGITLQVEFQPSGREPVLFETAWDVEPANQRADADLLTHQDYIDLYFFDEEMRYLFTRRLGHDHDRQRLTQMTINQADAYLAVLRDEKQQSQDRAKVRMRFFPGQETTCVKCGGAVAGAFRLVWNPETKDYLHLCQDCSRALENLVKVRGDIGLISMNNPRFVYWLREDRFLTLEDYWKLSQTGEEEPSEPSEESP